MHSIWEVEILTVTQLARHKVVLYFDVACPWSRVALTTLQRYVQVWNFDLDLQPVSRKDIVKHAEERACASVSYRRMFEDLQSASRLYDVPLNPPSGLEDTCMSTNAQSVLRTIRMAHPAQLDKAIDALYDAAWTNDEDVTDSKGIEAVLSKAKVFPDKDQKEVEVLVNLAITKENENALDLECEALVAVAGVFGAP